MTFIFRNHKATKYFLFFRKYSSRVIQNGVNMDWTTKGNPVAHFQNLPSTDTVQVYLQVNHEKLNRTFNFSRKLAENVDAFTGRVRGNLEKELAKKNKKKKVKGVKGEAVPEAPKVEVSEVELKVALVEDEATELEGITVQELLDKIAVNKTQSYYMNILGQLYKIQLNAPWVTNIQLPSSVLSGYLVYPNKLETLFCTKEDLQFIWYRGDVAKNEWTEVGRGYSYLAQNEDVNFQLKLQIVPKSPDSNLEFERTTTCAVQAGPGVCPFEERHLFTPEFLSGTQFRVVSYNILADLYADSDYSRDVLFGYCQKYAMNMDYRKQLFIKEINGYHGDIICLQEVDAKLFDLDLKTIYGEEQDYTCTFAEKRDVGEGVAILFRNSRFTLLDTYKFDVGENIQNLEILQEVNEKLKRNEQLFARVVERSTTLLVTVLRSLDDPQQVLIMANTHLYFHPDADHIRLLQAGMCVKYLQSVIVEEVKQKHVQGSDRISIIFSGDFNSDPLSGIFELMTKGSISVDHKDWGSSEWTTGFNYKILLINSLLFLLQIPRSGSRILNCRIRSRLAMPRVVL